MVVDGNSGFSRRPLFSVHAQQQSLCSYQHQGDQWNHPLCPSDQCSNMTQWSVIRGEILQEHPEWPVLHCLHLVPLTTELFSFKLGGAATLSLICLKSNRNIWEAEHLKRNSYLVVRNPRAMRMVVLSQKANTLIHGYLGWSALSLSHVQAFSFSSIQSLTHSIRLTITRFIGSIASPSLTSLSFVMSSPSFAVRLWVTFNVWLLTSAKGWTVSAGGISFAGVESRKSCFCCCCFVLFVFSFLLSLLSGRADVLWTFIAVKPSEAKPNQWSCRDLAPCSKNDPSCEHEVKS